VPNVVLVWAQPLSATILIEAAACGYSAGKMAPRCDTRISLTNAWNEAVQHMAVLVSDLKRAVNGDRETFDVAHARAEVARAKAETARAQLDLHRAEHGC
jgi:hypothetical protein